MAKKKNKKVHKKKASGARAASPKIRFKVKGAAKFQELASSTKLRSETAEVGQCWFPDPPNPDFCRPLTEEECKSEGGKWTPGDCPNS
jgi:hypothetical protein